MHPTLFSELHLNDDWPFSHVHQLYDKLKSFDSNAKNDLNKEFFKNTFQLSAEEIYEFGATALDCSIMVTFQCVETTDDITMNKW